MWYHLHVVLSSRSEFDVVAIVIHVGEVFTTAQQKKQWIFVADGSISEPHSEGISNSLLAISFCSPYADDESFVPMNCNLIGSSVCSFSCLFFLFQIQECIISNHIVGISFTVSSNLPSGRFLQSYKETKGPNKSSLGGRSNGKFIVLFEFRFHGLFSHEKCCSFC